MQFFSQTIMALSSAPKLMMQFKRAAIHSKCLSVPIWRLCDGHPMPHACDIAMCLLRTDYLTGIYLVLVTSPHTVAACSSYFHLQRVHHQRHDTWKVPWLNYRANGIMAFSPAEVFEDEPTWRYTANSWSRADTNQR